MKQKNKIFSFLLSGALAIGLSGVGIGIEEHKASAETVVNLHGTANENVSTRGIYTALSISINGGDGKIWTTVKNDVTIFPSTVWVIVELYASDTYQESHTNMELICRNSTTDLNMGKTIKAEAATGGVQKYWQGRMRYKVDGGAWKEGTTGTLLYSADGTFLDIV